MPNGLQANPACLQDPESRSAARDPPAKPRAAGAEPSAAKSGQDGAHRMTRHSRETADENNRQSDSNYPGKVLDSALEALSSPTIGGLLRAQPPNSRQPLRHRAKAADNGTEPLEPVDGLPTARWAPPSQAPVSAGNRPREHPHDRVRRAADCIVGRRTSERANQPCGGAHGETAMPTKKRSDYPSPNVPHSSAARVVVADTPPASPSSGRGSP